MVHLTKENIMFTGALILDISTTTDKDAVVRFLNFLALPYDWVGCKDLVKVKDPTAVVESYVNKLVTDADIESGLSMFATSTIPKFTVLQHKPSIIMSYVDGDISNKLEVENFFRNREVKTINNNQLLANMILRVNTTPKYGEYVSTGVEPEYQNYTHRVKDRVTDVLTGNWAGTLCFSSQHRDTVCIISKGVPIYFTLACIADAYILIWSTTLDYIGTLLSEIPANHELASLKEEIWHYCLSIWDIGSHSPVKSTLVVHPVYLLTKTRYFGKSTQFVKEKLAPKLETYLRGGAY